MYRVLLIEDDPAARLPSENALRSLGYEVRGVTASDALWVLETDPFDVVIACEASSSGPTPEARPLPTLLHVPSPLDPAKVSTAIANFEQHQWVQQQLRQVGEAPHEGPIIGRSPAMHRVRDMIHAIEESEAPVLLTGESGTGKDLLARTIHAQSPRRQQPLVVVNCAAFPETLLEAELFGYERGAFTGALQKREGRFKAADHGTLFLDEVNSLSLAAQAKLLRVLQDGTFQPIGTNATMSVDVRLVSATNRNLKVLVAEGRFREDLYYRIKVLDIEVPPLRDRRGDLPLLVQHFFKKYAPDREKPPAVTPRAWAALMKHGFPGNVRELEHAIHHALVLSRAEDIDLDHLPQDVTLASSTIEAIRRTDLQPLEDALGEFEREYLRRALEATGGNKTNAAKLLGISRKSLWQKLVRLGGTDGTNLEGSTPNEGGDDPEADTPHSSRRGRRRATRRAG